MKRPSLCVALLAISVAMPGAPAMAGKPGAETTENKENPAPSDNHRKSQEAKGEKLTTEVWVADSPPLDLHWHVLALPEYVVEMFFAPLGLLITTVERYRVDRRVYSLLRNDAGTVVVGPKFKISGSDGIGVGASLSLNRIFERNFYVKFSGLYRLNGDYELGVKYQRNLPWLEGRSLEFRMDYESNANLPYYGIGEDSTSDKQVLQEDFFDSYLSLDRSGLGALALSGSTQVGFRRSTLGTGTDAAAPGVGQDPLVPLLPPPGFGTTTNLAYVRFIIRLDSRDSSGRPTKGWLSQVEASFSKDLGGADLSSASARLLVSRFFPLFFDRRVLKLRGGLATSQPIFGNDEIPLHELVTLGRTTFLRGYSTARFRDRYGWWAGAEYRFPIWEYLDTGIALSPTFFVDVGGVSSTTVDLFDSKVRYSYGIGLRGARDTTRMLNVQFALSPEGSRFDLSFGKEF